MDRKLLKTVQTITTFRNRLADPVGTRRGPPFVRGPQIETAALGVCNMLLVGDADLFMLAIGIAGHLEMNNSVFVRWK